MNDAETFRSPSLAEQLEDLRRRAQASGGSLEAMRDAVADFVGREKKLLLYELLRSDVRRRRESGEVRPQDYDTASPTEKKLLKRIFQELEDAPADADAPAAASTIDFSRHPADGTHPQLAAAPAERPPRAWGDYDLQEQLGRGGMGVVYRAVQRSTGRLVALKVIRPERLAALSDADRTAAILRFRTEAKAAAKLDHPHIATVYEVGEHQGQPYFTMQCIRGSSLDAALKDGPPPPRRAAELAADVAEAVQAAHQRGILHRDLKPQNVLLDEESGRVLVADFGLAKLLESEEEMTLTGEVFGSPPYMAPEQARSSADATMASDVYGLGATLYALLTGEPPFAGGSSADVIQKVLNEPAPTPSRRNPAVPRDLDTICLKCLEKDPNRRYASAQEVADELRRHLRGDPVQARPVGRLERSWLWCRRNPLAAAFLTLAVIATLSGTIVSLNFAQRAAGRAADAEQQKELARVKAAEASQRATEAAQKTVQLQQANDAIRQREQRLRQEGYAATINSAYQAMLGGELDAAREAIETLRPADGQAELRGFDWRHLWRSTHPRALVLKGHLDSIRDADFSPDGRHLATASNDHTVRLWDLESGAQVRLFQGHSGNVISVAFSPDGKWLAAGEADPHLRGGVGAVLIHEVASGKTIAELKEHVGNPDGLVFAPAGDRLLVSSAAPSKLGGVTIYEAENWSVDRVLSDGHRPGVAGHPWGVAGAAFSPDARVLATAGYDGRVMLWQTEDWSVQRELQGHTGWVRSVAFSPDGTSVVSTSDDSTTRVWDVGTGKQLQVQRGGNRGATLSAAFAGRASHVVLGGNQGARLWNLETGSVLGLLPDGEVQRIAVSADGRRLAVTRNRQRGTPWPQLQVHVLPVSELGLNFELDPPGTVESVAFSPDGAELASVTARGTVQVWDAAQRLQTLNVDLKLNNQGLEDARLRPGGQLQFKAHVDGSWQVLFCDLLAEEIWLRLPMQTNYQATVFATSTDGLQVAHIRRERVRDTPRERFGDWIEFAFRDGQSVDAIHVSPPEGSRGAPSVKEMWFDDQDGLWLLCQEGLVGRVDLPSAELRWQEPLPKPTGIRLAAGSDLIGYLTGDSVSDELGGYATANQRLVVIGKRDGRKVSDQPIPARFAGQLLAGSPDGRYWTVGSYGSRPWMVLWDQQEARVVEEYDFYPLLSEFASDGRTLVAAERDGGLRMMMTANGQQVVKLRPHKTALRCLAFSPDGQMLVTGGGDLLRGRASAKPGELKLWAADPLEAADTPAAAGQPLEFGAGPPKVEWRVNTSQWSTLRASPRDGEWLALARERGKSIFRIDLADGEPSRIVEDLQATCSALAASPDGRLLAVGIAPPYLNSEEPREVQLRDAVTGTLVRRFDVEAPPIGVLAFSGDGETIAVGYQSGGVRLFTTDGGELLQALDAKLGEAACLAFSPAGDVVAAGGKAGLRVFDPSRAAPLAELASEPIGHAAFSPDGRHLAALTANRDDRRPGAVIIWDCATWEEVWRVSRTARVEASMKVLEFSADSQHLLFCDRLSSGMGFVLCDLASRNKRQVSQPLWYLLFFQFLPDGEGRWIGWDSMDSQLIGMRHELTDWLP